jgi:peptidoglycan/xylan/chitin deacetylase (PgdA/CDA1 family)
MKPRDLISSMLRRSGLGRAFAACLGAERLTVLAYHRVTPLGSGEFRGFRQVVSASPQGFERQLEWIRSSSFTPIGLSDLLRFMRSEAPLPPRALLITFDDGYADNYIHAFPALRRHGLPATIFLLTSGLDTNLPPWWDWLAWAFEATDRKTAPLPMVGQQSLAIPAQRDTLLALLMRRLKELPESNKRDTLTRIGDALAVAPPEPQPGLFMNWDQVREMSACGIEFQPHTVTHPILSRVPPDQAAWEIEESGRRITAETGQAMQAFAYPNGQAGDYDRTTIDALRKLGYAAAFTLVPGHLGYADVRRHALEIPRIYVGGNDSLDVFAVKLMGLSALRNRRHFSA